MQNELFSEKIIRFSVMAETDTDAIQKTGKLLLEAGYVNESYIESVIERERNFPTGLPLEDAALAIPHATPEENVWKNSIAVTKLAMPVKFHSMEDSKKFVDAEFVFLLALDDSEQHLEILKKMFTSFQKSEIIRALKGCQNTKEILGILREHFDMKKAEEQGDERTLS